MSSTSWKYFYKVEGVDTLSKLIFQHFIDKHSTAQDNKPENRKKLKKEANYRYGESI